MEDNNYTPEVAWKKETLYLIRVNKEEKAIVDNEHDAKLAVDSIAAYEMKKMENEKTKVYRQDDPSGIKVVVSKQSLGRVYNGSISVKIVVDYVPVKCVRVLRGRFESEKKLFLSPEDEKFLKSAADSVVLQDNAYTSESSSDTE